MKKAGSALMHARHEWQKAIKGLDYALKWWAGCDVLDVSAASERLKVAKLRLRYAEKRYIAEHRRNGSRLNDATHHRGRLDAYAPARRARAVPAHAGNAA